MKSVKSKLFTWFVMIIFMILLFLSIVTIYFFNINQQISTDELLSSSLTEVEKYIRLKKPIEQIDQHINLKNQFLLILKQDKLIFSNQSTHNTEKILDKLDFYDDDFYEEHLERLEKQSKKGLSYADEYALKIFDDKNFKVFLGIDQDFFEHSLKNIYIAVVVLNFMIFIILTILGYLLINKTIKPLKLILKELENLQDKEDLSKRLKDIYTNDEFEKLVISFNKMLEKIENSVENIKQFSSNASHELRTPLTIIQGEIELLNFEKCTNEELKNAISKINTEQKKLQEIITTFLLLARLEKEDMSLQKCQLDTLLFELIEQNIEAVESKKLELKLEIEDELEIKFDKKYLKIVLENILSNAIKYTQNGFISIQAKKQNNNIELIVQDSGIGFKKDEYDKIFERFYRADYARSDAKKGLGLGLAITKEICKKFSCEIKVKSELKKGSVFRLSFRV